MTNPQAEVERRLTQHRDDIDALHELVGEVKTIVEGHRTRFDGIDGRLDGIDGRLDGMDGRLDGIGGRLDGIDGRLGGLRSDVAEILRRLPA